MHDPYHVLYNHCLLLVFLLLPPLQALLVFLLVTNGDIVLLTIKSWSYITNCTSSSTTT